ncbi:MAG: hypothetical protein A2Z31_05210 [candidate division NC10 bacterium RBG_16_65_8]|nr:MAG: hypothetical protein A2Z31_05210 [candidate division NC10 bacterium RBG_16_65_8]
MRYEHTQRGTVVQVALLIGAAACFTLTQLVPAPPFVAPMVLVVFAICAYLFSSLTIQVTDRALHWCFGPGMFRKEVALTEIKTAEVTRTRLLEGWGIHKTSRGWLYNVSGFDAVRITLHSDKSILLGTDEPVRLRSAILRTIGRGR